MLEHGFTGPGVTVGLALAVGMLAQAVAHHLRLPGIVLLLGAGVLLGPDVAGLVRPETLGGALPLLVGFAVAVILFEGGLNLNMKRLKREARTIRALLTIGAAITALGGMLAAVLLMGWDWMLAALFGSLVIVTGPTVITPLLRRIRVTHRIETVLEAEGVLIDAIGAVVAVVTLQVVVSPGGPSFAAGFVDVLSRLGVGCILGGVGGLLLALLLRVHRVVPEGLENVLTLSLVLALFQASNALMPESGIMSVTMAGLVVGNMRTHVGVELKEFKEQLTVLFIGMLFVLLAADVRVAEVVDLGLPGVLTVLFLMFVVRPLNVAACTIRSELDWRERTFLAWLSPRGVVAAAVASLFAQDIAEFGIAGGDELRALVFLVIAGTVLVQGLTGGLVASLLGVRRPAHLGYAIVGANELGHTLGRLLRAHGEQVVFIDSNPNECHVVERDGFRVVFGNPLSERSSERAQLEDRAACIAVTTSDEINLMVGRHAVGDYRLRPTYVALSRTQSMVNPEMVEAAGCRLLFGEPRDLELWSLRVRRGTAAVEARRLAPTQKAPDEAARSSGTSTSLLPLVVVRRGSARPVAAGDRPRDGDVGYFAVFEERREEAEAWLAAAGWTEVQPTASAEPPPAPGGTGPRS